MSGNIHDKDFVGDRLDPSTVLEGYETVDPEVEAARAKYLKELESRYGDPVPKSVDDDAYADIDGDDADPLLLEAANTLSDPLASREERDSARQTLLDAPGLEEYAETYEDEPGVPTDKAEYKKMLTDSFREAQQPESPYGPDDSAADRQRAVRAVAVEAALQRKVHELLRDPGHTQDHRPENERAAIAAVRREMLRMKGIESHDLDNPPEVSDRQAAIDELFDADIEQERLDAEALEAEDS